jgi:chromosome segregation ATPase
VPVAKRQVWYGDLLLGAGDDMESLKVLDANLAHVQRDVAEIKSDQRRAGERLDDMNGRLDVLRDKVDHVRSDINKRIDDTGARIDLVAEKVVETRTDLTGQLVEARTDLTAEVVQLRTDLTAQIGDTRKDLTTRLDTVRKELTADIKGLSAEVGVLRTDMFQRIDLMRGELFAVKSSVAAAKVWTLTLQLTIAAALLGVMAHGFKWI